MLCTAARAARAEPDRLVLLDGSAADEIVTAIDTEGLVHRQSGKPALDLQDLRRIERPVKPDAAKPAPCEVYLHSGGVVRAKGVAAEDKRLTVRWAFGGKLVLPLAVVRAVRLGTLSDEKDEPLAPAFAAALLQVVRGGLVRIAEKQIDFQWNDAQRKVGRDRVYGVVFAQFGDAPDLAGQCRVLLKDGSSLWGVVTGLRGGKLALRPAEGVDVRLPWNAVTRLDVRSTKMTFLSDLDPIDVVQEALVTYVGPWRRDLNVVGGPLTLGKTVYEKGLGVHARCELTYAVGGRYDVFAAVIGLDASALGRGDCVFRVEADGSELFTRRMRGTDRPKPVRLEIAGAQRLTLIVDYGEDLDLADRANWADARVQTQRDKP
jgi:hypothetical protein